MSTAAQSFSGNLKKALVGPRRIDLEGLRWRVFDALNGPLISWGSLVLGRLASHISTVVRGKDKPTYTPNREEGHMCIIINAKDVCVTRRKMTDKFYWWHTGYIGHLKERSLKDQMAKDPTEVIRKTVLRMLPRNKLRDDRDRKPRIFAGSEHPFGDRPLEQIERIDGQIEGVPAPESIIGYVIFGLLFVAGLISNINYVSFPNPELLN